MQNRKPLRFFVVIAAVALLLVPGLLMTLAWGGALNLEVAAAAIAITIMAAVWLPRLKWLIAIAAALLIAVPPFPYWANWDERRGRYLHFFHGFPFEGELVIRFGVVFAMAMVLFAAMFWAIGKPKK
ncbi:hypothetical protein Q2B95_04145 [Stenotrophomonas maltophilia]